MLKILITDSDHDSVDVERQAASARGIHLALAQCRTEDDVIEAASDADGIVVQYAPISRRVLHALPKLRCVGRYGVGVDTVDVEAATERGIAVVNVPDYGTQEVSDHAISLALSASRAIPELDRGIRTGEYGLAKAKPLHRFATRTFGVVGLGHIGAATARKARGAGFRVLGSDPLHEPGTQTADGIDVVSFDELLQRCDLVSLHAPLVPSTHHMMSVATLSAMRPGAILVNTSRGGLVDTSALVAALREGHLGGAALDVFEVEPVPSDSDLLKLPNVILTPHAAWYSEESYEELKRRVVENVADALEGVRPRNLVNESVWTNHPVNA